MKSDMEPGTATFSPARLIRNGLVLCIAACCLSAQQSAPQQYTITPGVRAILDHVSADSLRGHLSFIASDALEGRNTPSKGLDIAAEYIAAQFRRAGLEPAGDDGYFQTASVTMRGADKPVRARNVVGVLRGSDPALKD